MDELRWILLGLGTLIIVGVYGYSRFQSWSRVGLPWRRRRSEPREPFAGHDEPALDDDDGIIGAVHVQSNDGAEQAPSKTPVELFNVTDEPQQPLDIATPEAEGEEKIVALSVMPLARPSLPGQALLEALTLEGLRLTEQGVFRRGLDTNEGTVALYTVANIVEPGTFSPETIEQTEVAGVLLIMHLPGPFDGLSTFEQMLNTARRIADRLNAQVLDGRRCDLTTQSIEHIREDLIEYRRRARLASRREH